MPRVWDLLHTALERVCSGKVSTATKSKNYFDGDGVFDCSGRNIESGPVDNNDSSGMILFRKP
jgi:hypothetical protein